MWRRRIRGRICSRRRESEEELSVISSQFSVGKVIGFLGLLVLFGFD